MRKEAYLSTISDLKKIENEVMVEQVKALMIVKIKIESIKIRYGEANSKFKRGDPVQCLYKPTPHVCDWRNVFIHSVTASLEGNILYLLSKPDENGKMSDVILSSCIDTNPYGAFPESWLRARD